MRVYKCDRCGKYVSRTARDFFVRKPTSGIYKLSKKIHLCSGCAKSFRMWLWYSDPDMDEAKEADDAERRD